ncbi:Dak1 domain-containing protein [Bisporella sp. PMI_857]|nr:Dak1 domain-containing protein [Bisporella sp. PMI_857]
MSKSFVDDTSDLVIRSLRGVVRFSPGLFLDPTEKRNVSDKVILLSGGGSGHEPAHAGFIGEGMLDAVIAGNIFASPSASQIFKAIKAFPSEKGTLIIAKNYTGDALSFGLATEKAKAAGITCKLLLVGDDISIPHKVGSTIGRRGLAGVVLVHKIAGAAAVGGASLEEVYSIAESVARNMATIGVSLQRCHVPGRTLTSEDEISLGELEYGMGIHNEPGVQRARIGSLHETVGQMLSRLLDENQSGRSFVTFVETDIIVLALNNLGGLSTLELHAILDEILTQLSSNYRIIPRRIIRGTLVSSMNGLGFSITLLKLNNEMIPLLDRATDAPGWIPAALGNTEEPPETKLCLDEGKPKLSSLKVDAALFTAVLREISSSITADEPAITHFDTVAGDGDCGETLLAGSNAIAAALQRGEINTSDLIGGLHTISNIIEASMGGTSGAIYGIYLNGLVSGLNNSEPDTGHSTSVILSIAAGRALKDLFRYTRARKGSRTMMDVLIPFIENISSDPSGLTEALEAARQGMESTKKMKALFGRASYVDQGIFEREEEGGIPDAGALGLLSIISSLVKTVQAQQRLSKSM